MNKFTKQCVAAFASLAMAGTLCVAGAVVANSSAWAVDNNCNAGAPWSTACANQKGKITINKQDASKNNAALPGATFTIQKVTNIKTGDSDTTGLTVDLKSVDGWTKLAEKVKQLNTTPLDEAKLTLDAVSDANTKTTGTDGKAEFDNLDLGLYLVKEKSAPAGYATDVKPFFMTVPEITRGDSDKNNTYTYEVSVSPKNTNVANNVTKTADTEKIVGAGDTLPYTITATVNKKKSDAADSNTGITKDELQGFAVFDDAVTNAYDSVAKDVVKEVKIVGQKDAMVAADYTVTSEALTAPGDTTRTRIKVKFNDSGLTKIATAVNAADAAETKVTVKLELKLKDDISAFVGSNDKLTNKSGFVPGHTAGVPDTPTTGGEVSNEFRKFHIFKYDGAKGKDDTNAKLKDAKFKVFAGANGDTNTDKAALAVAQKCADDPSDTDNCKTALTGFGEKSTSEQGVTPDYIAKVGQKFYIVETAAPNGYARSTKVYEVTLTTAAKNADAQVVYIANVPTKDNGSWFHLPKTGAAGVIIFALAGVCLVCLGIFLFMRNRKKEEEQQAA